MKRITFLLVFLLILLLITSNCTLIGIGIGTIADAHNNNEYLKIDKELFSISQGTSIDIISIDGDTLEGIFENTSNLYTEDYINEYNRRYEEIRNKLVIPMISDTLIISTANGRSYQYLFLGFDYNSVYAKHIKTDKDYFITMNPEYKFKIANEEYLDIYWIKNSIEYKTIPILSKINIENDGEINSLFYHQIQKLNTKSSSVSAVAILAGITVDLLIFKNSDFPLKPKGW